MLKDILYNRAALYGVITKIIQGMAGILTVIFTLRFFSPALQGYYYTFASILALQIFLELGLSNVISTFAAHEWAQLGLDASGKVTGNPEALSRLKSLTRKVMKWYLVASLPLLVLLLAGGFLFFDAHDSGHDIAWQYPWLAVCLLTAANFIFIPAWALLSGCGQFLSLNVYKLVDTVVRYLVLWCLIASGASLWAMAGPLACSAVGAAVFLALRHKRFFSTLLTGECIQDRAWFRELAPLQARIAVSWASGYFAFSLFTPVVFHFLGVEDAGKMGMTWSLIGGLTGIAGSWLQVQAPAFSGMVAKAEFKALDMAVLRTLWISVMFFLAEACVALGGLYFLRSHFPEIAGRFLPLGPILVFFAAEWLHQISMVQSTYLRAFKREPFLWVSVVSGLIIGIGTLWLTPVLDTYGPAISYLAGVATALVWGSIIFVRHRERQAASPEPA